MKNLSTEQLIAEAVNNGEGKLTKAGSFYTTTGQHTGRSPGAKAIVKDDITKDLVDWKLNFGLLPGQFKLMMDKFQFYKNNRRVYSQDVWAVKDDRHSVPLTVYTLRAKHSLFTRNMFIPDQEAPKKVFIPEWEVFHFPPISEKPMVWISFSEKKILIAGTSYSGEIKKSVFTVLNFLFPSNNHLPMHCSVNVDKNGNNPAVFFGLSGTGKTTLSSDVNRVLIGDDEHAWTDTGLTNFEGGCYAKTINLTPDAEPQIHAACFKKGTILENVVVENGVPNFFNTSITENGRASYPLSSVDGFHKDGYVDLHPKNIIMLTCDAFGVLPPVMKLTPKEAIEQFLLGYTAKVAGTEKGVKEPKATFSPCFGLPFMPLPPQRYGEILKEKIEKHKPNCWLVNTGWTGGPYGVGGRIPIKITRSIIDSILDNTLADAGTFVHIHTGFSVPIVPPSVIPTNVLHPELGWGSQKEYEQKVWELMRMFKEKIGNKI